MNDKALQRIKLVLLGFAVVIVFAASNRASAPERYMVRAILLEKQKGEYCVGVVYQAPQAAANSADATPSFLFEKANGTTVSQAFLALEQTLNAPLSYRMSDYLVLSGRADLSALEEYLGQLQSIQKGRVSAYSYFFAQPIEAFVTAAQQDPSVLQTMLETLEQRRGDAPRLYQVAQEWLIMPFLQLQQDGTIAPQKELVQLQKEMALRYDQAQAAYYRLGNGIIGVCDFVVNGKVFSLEHRVMSRIDGNKGTTLKIYAFVSQAETVEQATLEQVEEFLEEQMQSMPVMLQALGITNIEIELYSLSLLF